MKPLNDTILLNKYKNKLKQIIISFFGKILLKTNNVNVDILLVKISEIIEQYQLKANYEEITFNVAACDFQKREILFYENFFRADSLEKTLTLIHEYVHVISKELAGISEYDGLEEGFADFISKICVIDDLTGGIFDYHYDDEKMNEQIKKILDLDWGYNDCFQIVRTILGTLKTHNKDLEGIVDFCLMDKKKFDLLCQEYIKKYPSFLTTIEKATIDSEINIFSSFKNEAYQALQRICGVDFCFDENILIYCSNNEIIIPSKDIKRM